MSNNANSGSGGRAFAQGGIIGGVILVLLTVGGLLLGQLQDKLVYNPGEGQISNWVVVCYPLEKDTVMQEVKDYVIGMGYPKDGGKTGADDEWWYLGWTPLCGNGKGGAAFRNPPPRQHKD